MTSPNLKIWGYYLIPGSGDQVYSVRLGLDPDEVTGQMEPSSHCTCKAYQYNHKRTLRYHCKHIEEAWRLMRVGLRGGSLDYPFPVRNISYDPLAQTYPWLSRTRHQ